MPTVIEIQTIINTANSAEATAPLKKSLRELVSLQSQVGSGSEHFKTLQKAINETEGKIASLNDGFQTLRGSGVDRLNSSLGLLREGFSSADPGKLSIAFNGLKAAMNALPIFLLIQGVQLLVENFDKLVGFAKGLFDAFTEEGRAVAKLNKEYQTQLNLNTELNAQLSNEIELLKAKKAPLSEILKLEQEQFNLQIKTNEAKLASLKATLEQQKQEKSLTDVLLGQNSVLGALLNVFEGTNKKRVDKTKETQKAISETESAIEKLTVEKEVNKINKINEINAKELEARKKRIADFQDFLKIKTQEEIEIEQDRINIENRLGQEELEKAKKIVQENKDFRQAIAEGISQQDQEIADKNEAKRRTRLENNLAYDKSFAKKSLDEKIEAIEKDRETQLLNEDLTQQQRIAIIEKAENDILQIKVKYAQQYVTYAKLGLDVLNQINQAQTQNENAELEIQKDQKDQSLENDTKRTDSQVENEKAKTERLLENDELTSEEREQIKRDSEIRINNIQRSSQLTQDGLNKDFAKKENAIKKEQFEKNKALQLASAVVNTAAAVLQTLAATPYPANIPLAIAVGAAGLFQIGIIASQQYKDTAASQATSTPVFSGGGSGGGQTPTESRTPTSFNPQAIIPQNQRTSVSQPQKVYVLEKDIRDTMNKVDVFESRATF